MNDSQLTIRYKQSIDVINKLNDFLLSVKASNYFKIEDLFYHNVAEDSHLYRWGMNATSTEFT